MDYKTLKKIRKILQKNFEVKILVTNVLKEKNLSPAECKYLFDIEACADFISQDCDVLEEINVDIFEDYDCI